MNPLLLYELLEALALLHSGRANFLDYADMQQATLDELARNWLESEEGVSEAMATVDADDDEARERAAEYRAEMWRGDR